MVVDTAQPQAVRAGCYCRISSDPKDKRHGVDRQRQDTAALCEIKGWEVAAVYVDNDKSASSGKERPQWDRLLADVKAGTIDAIAAWDQDRGWRMMAELEELRKFFTSLGRPVLLATTGQGDIDLFSPTGVMLAQVKTAVSEHEIAMMRVRQKRAGRQRAEQGRPKWKRAFGYLPDTRAKEYDDGTRQLDPVVAPLVRDGYAAIVAGASLRDVATMWNEAGAFGRAGKPWNQSLVSQFLRKPRNAALREYEGEIVGKGTWPPLVDESLWRAAQAAINRRPGNGGRGTRRSVRRHPLTNVLTCGKCEGLMSGGRAADGSVMYVCKGCRGVSVRANGAEPLLLRMIGGRLAKSDASDLLKAEQIDPAEARRLADEKAGLYAELDQLAIERARKLLTARQVQIASAEIQAQIEAIEEKERDAERVRVLDGIPLGTPQAVDAVAKLTPDRLRAVVGLLCKQVRVAAIGKSGNTFNPERIKFVWWRPEEAE
jgi:DNA invertase Pin-like site-specific DNA recombinase